MQPGNARKSARPIWNKASPSGRLHLLRDAGCRCLAQAYRRFEDLPATVKVQLNLAQEQAVQHQGKPAPMQPELI
jgi:hypothetical protein